MKVKTILSNSACNLLNIFSFSSASHDDSVISFHIYLLHIYIYGQHLLNVMRILGGEQNSGAGSPPIGELQSSGPPQLKRLRLRLNLDPSASARPTRSQRGKAAKGKALYCASFFCSGSLKDSENELTRQECCANLEVHMRICESSGRTSDPCVPQCRWALPRYVWTWKIVVARTADAVYCASCDIEFLVDGFF